MSLPQIVLYRPVSLQTPVCSGAMGDVYYFENADVKKFHENQKGKRWLIHNY